MDIVLHLTITIYDYANTIDAVYTVRVAANGVLGQPVFTARGLDWNVASATITGSGYAEEFQTGQQIVLTGVHKYPMAKTLLLTALMI